MPANPDILMIHSFDDIGSAPDPNAWFDKNGKAPIWINGVEKISNNGVWSDVGGSSSSATVNITSSRNSVAGDNGNYLVNSTGSNFTYTLASGMGANFGVALIQQSTGTITIAAGAGVTFVGATLATTSAGDVISVIWLSSEAYLIKLG